MTVSAAERDAWLSSALTSASASSEPVKDSAPAAKEPETPTPEGEDAGTEAEPSTAEDSTDQTDSGDVSSDDNADPSTATGEADAETETDDAESEPSPPKRGTAAARIQDLIAENKSLRAFGEHVLSELKAKAPAASAEEKPTPAPTASVDEPAPTLESCGFDAEKFSKETTAWARKIARAEAAAEVGKFTAQAEVKAAQDKFTERAAAFAKGKDDYDVVMSNRQLPGMHEDTARTIVLSDDGPAIAYYLAKNPDQATRLSRMSRDQQLVRVGEIKSQLKAPVAAAASTEKKPVPKQKKPTQAPTPPAITPAGSSTVKKNPLDSSMSMDEWVAMDRAQKADRRQAQIALRDKMRRK